MNEINKAAVKSSKPDRKSPSFISRKIPATGDGSGKTGEELAKEFTGMDNDAKINLITNIETFEPVLLSLAFSDKSADVRLAATQSLAWLETDQKNILPFIAAAMKDGTTAVRDESCSLMDSLEDSRDVLSLLEPAINSEFADVRLNAVSKFIEMDIPKEEFRNLVVKALSDKDEEVRIQALLSASFLWDQEFSSEDEAIKYLSK